MKIYEIGKLPELILDKVGGKARGLDFLAKNGFKIPKGFIVTEVENIEEKDFSEILSKFKELNVSEVSVRSSASNEDGTEFSNAGQYDTCLNVNENDLIESVKKCIDSLNSARVKAYSSKFLSGAEAKMNLVIQTMINSKFAGVTFSIDPSNKENVLIESVEGLGENLVSGAKSAERFSISRNQFDAKSSNTISLNSLNQIYKEALEIEKIYQLASDLEWAIDENDTLYWLQLRPITASAEEVSLDEFNPKNSLENHLVTKRNIGEMMPGAVTPLSISTSVLALDYGMRNMLKEIGAIKNVSDRPDYFCALAIKNHLFIDLTALHTMSKKVIGATPEAMNLSILGEVFENYPEPEGKNAFFIKKMINGMKFGKYLFSSKKAKRKIVDLAQNLHFDCNENSKNIDIYNEITNKLFAMNKALCYHYVCSSFSGTMNSALYMTLGKEFENKSEYQAFASNLLLNIDGIESADILKCLKNIASLIIKEIPSAIDLTNEELLNVVSNSEHLEINKHYVAFLKKHGHRSIKEAEFRSKSWKNDQLSLMQNLHTVILSYKEDEEEIKPFDIDELIKNYKKKGAIKWIAKNARQAVIDREFSKSRIIKVIDKFKDQYILLAKNLVKDGLLTDEDSIYFLSHQEIKNLLDGETSLKRKALARRNKFKESENIRFDDIYIGEPKPLDIIKLSSEKTLSGIPVCKGKVYGKARVIYSKEDANELKENEIMVAPFTDIGWSPYYSLVGALITEVGSALSHGAVVAREYALPTIVNVKNATLCIKTGDYLYVNADEGNVSIITEEEYKTIKGEN